jgi:hypothetical protein
LPKCNAGHAQMTEAERTEDDAETALWDRALEDPWATNEARGALARSNSTQSSPPASGTAASAESCPRMRSTRRLPTW